LLAQTTKMHGPGKLAWNADCTTWQNNELPTCARTTGGKVLGKRPFGFEGMYESDRKADGDCTVKFRQHKDDTNTVTLRGTWRGGKFHENDRGGGRGSSGAGGGGSSSSSSSSSSSKRRDGEGGGKRKATPSAANNTTSKKCKPPPADDIVEISSAEEEEGADTAETYSDDHSIRAGDLGTKTDEMDAHASRILTECGLAKYKAPIAALGGTAVKFMEQLTAKDLDEMKMPTLQSRTLLNTIAKLKMSNSNSSS